MIAADAASIGAGALWLQQGIRSPQARDIAIRAGLEYVEDTCLGTTVATMRARAPVCDR
jgi:predicted CoA-binding protein